MSAKIRNIILLSLYDDRLYEGVILTILSHNPLKMSRLISVPYSFFYPLRFCSLDVKRNDLI